MLHLILFLINRVICSVMSPSVSMYHLYHLYLSFQVFLPYYRHLSSLHMNSCTIDTDYYIFYIEIPYHFLMNLLSHNLYRLNFDPVNYNL